MNRLLKSTCPSIIPMGGMITSLTSEVTILPNAAPMITPTARSMTFPRAANSLNSFSIALPPLTRRHVTSRPGAIFLAVCYFHSTFSREAPSKLVNRHQGALPGPAQPLVRQDGNLMKTPHHHELSRREREIIDILYTQGRATAAEVQGALPDPPSYSAVRAMLRIL